MPELPEVATVIRGISDARARTILDVKASPHIREHEWWRSKALRGMVVTGFQQRGKYIILNLLSLEAVRHFEKTGEVQKTKGAYAFLVIHLGMSGVLTFNEPEGKWARHAHLTLRLSGTVVIGREDHASVLEVDPQTVPQRTLYFVDPRKFGFTRLCRTKKRLAQVLKGVGPSFTDLPSVVIDGKMETYPWPHGAVVMIQRMRELYPETWPLKDCLMDQRAVSGFGNIYAAEALFLAGLLPIRTLGETPDRWLVTLYEESDAMFRRALRYGGSTVSSFKNADGEHGHAQEFLFVYGRQGLPCLRCGTTIESAKMAGRTTNWCPNCQR